MSVREKITGSFDLIFLFGRGIDAFKGKKKDVWLSVFLVMAMLPLTLAAAYYYPPKGMEEGYGYGQIAATVAAHSILSFILSALAVALAARLMDKQKYFWIYFEASNWVSVCFSLLTAPLAVIAIKEILPRAEMDRALALLGIYGFVVAGCIAYRAFKTNWQLAAAISIVTMFVSQELSHLLYLVQGITIPW